VPQDLLNAFTVDVEDYFQVSAFEGAIPRDAWESVAPRIDNGLSELLDLVDGVGVRGTFFVLGWVARRRPDLLRAIAGRGHEIGCHSHEHRLVYSQTPEGFRADLRLALDAIQEATGRPCVLYRAPTFSITRKSLWALPILAEEGIRLDSSIYPVVHDRYGIPGAPRFPYRPLRTVPDFVEFPPATFRLFGTTLPCAGGGYLRIYPPALTRYALRQINGTDGQPALVYVHPWELDPAQPVVPVGRLRNLRHRMNLHAMASRLAGLLTSFRFSTLEAAVASLGGPEALPFHDLTRASGAGG
jgi:polysaccharide deacetylase family protein (PEP-CTERM system associated)